jgi:hypothetical protein
MEHCANHPDLVAVEHCEICGRPLCGHCLWYEEESGRRLCENHAMEMKAAGAKVLPPETYAEAIDPSLVRRPGGVVAEAAIPGQKFYQGNSQDLGALIAAVVAITTLASCAGGAYCLPVFALILGIAMYSNASAAHDPQRTRKLAGVGIGVGALFLVLVVVYIGMMGLFMAMTFAMAATAGGAP